VNTDNPENKDQIPENAGPPSTEPEGPESSEPGSRQTPDEDSAAEFPDLDEPEQTVPDTEKMDAPVTDTEIKPRRGGGFLAFLAFVFALAALVGTAWMWWQDSQGTDASESRLITEISRLESNDSELDLKLKQIRDQVESIPSGDSSAEVSALERRLQSDIDEMDRLQQSMSEQLAVSRSLQIAGEALQRRLSAAETALAGVATRELDAGGELDLAEVDYLLRLANERLKLFGDPVAADETLELADMHLAAMDDPLYLGVRQDIAAARRDLAALDMPDYFEIGNQLDSIQALISGLQFKGQEVAPEESTEAADGWWAKLKGVFSGLVTVRRSTELENQRISLEDKDYVRQRLWLQLEITHLALMRRDQAAFRNSLERVRETLSAWFDVNSAAYQEITGHIESLEEMEIQLELPDISQPWSTLRQVRTLRVRPAAAPVAEQAGEAEELEPAAMEEESLPQDEQG